VERHVGILPPELCKELIRLGNLDGFNSGQQQFESIDDFCNNNTPSQSIEVYEGGNNNGSITSPAIWKVLEPYIPQLTQLVKQSIDKDTDRMYFSSDNVIDDSREPQLDWVFFRKYGPDTPRNSLKLHVDSNMHTLNIALNDDFTGGGLFYVCPPAQQQEETEDGRPNIPYEELTYDWLNNVKRENTTDIVFPNMNMGDVLIHNYTVWHAVAPIEVGTRYSFVLFYDMDNPAIQQTDFYDDDTIIAVFYHEIEDVEIDLVWAGNAAAEEEDDGDDESDVIMIEEKMKPFEDYALDTSEGEKFRALIGDVVVAEFVIRSDYKEMRGDGKYQSICVNFYP